MLVPHAHESPNVADRAACVIARVLSVYAPPYTRRENVWWLCKRLSEAAKKAATACDAYAIFISNENQTVPNNNSTTNDAKHAAVNNNNY